MIYIGIHVMPWEIGEFRHQVRLHRLTLSLLTAEERANFTLVPTLNLSEKIINWPSSQIPQEFYIEHFTESCKTLDGLIPVDARIGGVTSTSDALRLNIEQVLSDEDFYIWLDPDISYPKNYWKDVLDSINALKIQGGEFILTPSTTKLWDKTWDILVCDEQKNLPYGYDQINETAYEEFYDRECSSLDATPYVKFAGGWGNVFSGALLKRFGIPAEYSTYGGIDTYIMFGADFLRKRGELTQYKMNNCVTLQDFRFSDKEMYKKFTAPLIDQDTQRAINQQSNQVFETSVLNLIRRLAQ